MPWQGGAEALRPAWVSQRRGALERRSRLRQDRATLFRGGLRRLGASQARDRGRDLEESGLKDNPSMTDEGRTTAIGGGRTHRGYSFGRRRR